MQASELFNALNKTKDHNGYSGALSTKEIRILDIKGNVYNVDEVLFDADAGCYHMKVSFVETMAE